MKMTEIVPLKAGSSATIEIPGSKSYTNRALIVAALTKKAVIIHNPLYSEDTCIMIDCLKTLGIHIETFPDKMIVHNDISAIKNTSYQLFAKDSGTSIRFLLALLCIVPGTKTLFGNARLNERPIKGLVDALRLLGAKIEYLAEEGKFPLKIDSQCLKSKQEISIDSSLSSQFLSALLLISPYANGLTIRLSTPLISKPYVKMTTQLMQEAGINLINDNECYSIPEGQHYIKDHYLIEGDFSSAGYFFAIAALTQSTFYLKNLNSNSLQADRIFLNIIENMGNSVSFDNEGLTIVGKQISSVSLNMEDCPDQVQTLAVLASFTPGITKISGIRSLRLKETERVKAVKNELAKMNIRTEDTEDSIIIYGGSPKAAIIDTYGDHRMAMAFAVAGTKLPGMKICNPEVVNKTFPTFWEKIAPL